MVVSVVRVEHRGGEAEVQYCQDDRKLLYYSLDNLSAPPKPVKAHIQPNKFSVRLIRTTGKAADGTTSDEPRWLVADPTGLDPEDPACLAPIAAVRVPPIALHPRPGEI